MSIPSNWYENFFHGIPLDLWRKAIPPKQTRAEADFLIQTLQCETGSHLLDIPCGNGRLSLEIARHGYRVTGVDISEEFIQEARACVVDPPTDAGGTPVPQFVLGDMRRIEGREIYDGAFCFGNSFGFLEYGDMETFLQGVARGLKAGARFVIETGMAAESILPKFEAQSSHQFEDIVLTINERYLADESCIDTDYVFERNGNSETRSAKHWIYTTAEIRRMLERAGLVVRNLYGSVKCEPFVLGSAELIVVAQRE